MSHSVLARPARRLRAADSSGPPWSAEPLDPAPRPCANVRAMGFSSFKGPDFTFDAPPGDGPLLPRLAAWHRQALAAGRVPCLYLTATWCPPSVQLEKSLADPRMQRALRELDVATLDIDRAGEELSSAGFRVTSVPVFYLLDAEGRATGRIDGGAWKENVPETMAPPLETFFDAARAARPAPAAGGSKLVGVVMLIVAIALIAAAAWFKVSSDEAQRKQENDERMRQDIQRTIQQSLQNQNKG